MLDVNFKHQLHNSQAIADDLHKHSAIIGPTTFTPPDINVDVQAGIVSIWQTNGTPFRRNDVGTL